MVSIDCSPPVALGCRVKRKSHCSDGEDTAAVIACSVYWFVIHSPSPCNVLPVKGGGGVGVGVGGGGG